MGDRKRREREKERMKGEGDKGKAGRRKETERGKGTGRNFGHFVQAAKLAAALSRVARVESTGALQKPSSSIIDEQ